MKQKLNKDSYALYAAKSYTEPILSVSEFNANIAYLKRIKSNLNRKYKGKTVNILLVFNQIITLTNVFKPEAVVRMCFYACDPHLHSYLLSIFTFIGLYVPGKVPELHPGTQTDPQVDEELDMALGSRYQFNNNIDR